MCNLLCYFRSYIEICISEDIFFFESTRMLATRREIELTKNIETRKTKILVANLETSSRNASFSSQDLETATLVLITFVILEPLCQSLFYNIRFTSIFSDQVEQLINYVSIIVSVLKTLQTVLQALLKNFHISYSGFTLNLNDFNSFIFSAVFTFYKT